MFSKPSKNNKSSVPPTTPSTSTTPESEDQTQDQSVELESDESTNTDIDDKFAELKSLIHSTDATSDLNEMSEIERQYRFCLMENISEGVIFVNRENEITCWNRSVAIITGLTASNMVGAQFTTGIMGLTKPGAGSSELECPVEKCLNTRKQTSVECLLAGKSGRQVTVELTAVPVMHAMQCHGVVILIKDLSANKDLKKQLTELKNTSAIDPLTGVANRAEFEKTLKEYIVAHNTTESKCCLIVCDIDFFKMVNDTYGHNVGDQALIAFARTLEQFVRSRDIVARYGGEEFVILCANCDLENAVDRAEQIRQSLNKTPQAMLDGKTLSSSFGVAELRPHEETTDFFVRADKALYAAKQNGRNRVEKAVDETPEVQTAPKFERSPATGMEWKKLSKGSIFCEEYCTTTPSDLLASKLKGFIVETKAEIRKIQPNYASLTVLASDRKNESKKTHFRVDIEFQEPEQLIKGQAQTFIRITIFTPRQRMFRRIHEELHVPLLTDIRRFLMITDDSASVTLNPAATSSGRD